MLMSLSSVPAVEQVMCRLPGPQNVENLWSSVLLKLEKRDQMSMNVPLRLQLHQLMQPSNTFYELETLL